MKKRPVFFFLTALLLLTIAFPNAALAQTKTDRRVSPSQENANQVLDQKKINEYLSEKAAKRKIVHIIVELKTKFVDEGKLTENAKALQRAKILADQKSFLKTFDAKKILREYKFKNSPFIALSVDEETFDKLASSTQVKSIREDIIVKPSLDVSIPWIGADLVHALPVDGSGWVVAVLDTGVATGHPAFTGKTVEEGCFSTSIPAFSISSLCPGADTDGDAIGSGTGINCSITIDGCEHGTHVAGIAVGNGGGIVGVAPGANLMPIQVFSRFNDPADCFPDPAPCIGAFGSDVIAALNYVESRQLIRGDIVTVNLSLGGGLFTLPCATDPAVANIISLEAAGVAVVAASGNDFSVAAVSWPACLPGVLSVGATTTTKTPPPDAIASFSNSYNDLTLLAPGVDILSAVPPSGTATFSGTSQASPHVAGAIALIKSTNAAATVDDARTTLVETGVRLLDINGVRTPRIQLDQAIDLVSNSVACPDPISTYTIILGTPGPDYLTAFVKSIIVGNGGDDQIIGSEYADCIFGGTGADRIRSMGGPDIVYGGSDADQISGGTGNDEISGDDGIDRLVGDDGLDILFGGDDDDSIAGKAGDDLLLGGGGNDRISGGTENDTISGDEGDDQMGGGDGDDSIDGGGGNDICSGGTGTNTITTCEVA